MNRFSQELSPWLEALIVNLSTTMSASKKGILPKRSVPFTSAVVRFCLTVRFCVATLS